MKKALPYFLVILLVLMLLFLMVGNVSKKNIDKRFTLNRNSTQLYGTKVFTNLLQYHFKNAEWVINKQPPSQYIYLSPDSYQLTDSTLLIIISKQFNPNNDELRLLKNFIANGNQVLIASPTFNDNAKIGFDIDVSQLFNFFADNDEAVTKVKLLKPLGKEDTLFSYPGQSTKNYFTHLNANYQLLGTDSAGRANFVRGKLGNGYLYLHTNPYMFTNYFILHKQNYTYIQAVLSVIKPSIHKIIIDDYYFNKPNENEKQQQPSLLRVLWQNTSFKWAIILAIILLGIYFLLHVKRLQKQIPIIEQPVNTSLAFVDTIGKLYFQRKDHVDLAKKMSLYFLEHIRSKYFIDTGNLDDDFVEKLAYKSGVDKDVINQILLALKEIETAQKISEKQLNTYYILFNKFYKST